MEWLEKWLKKRQDKPVTIFYEQPRELKELAGKPEEIQKWAVEEIK